MVPHAPPLAGYNVLFVVIDALRADHVGAYGYARNTTPFIDELAAAGVRFEHVLSNSSYTRESVSSLFTGRYPSRAQAVGWEAAPAEGHQTLAERMQAAGYHTALFSASRMLRKKGFHQGFDKVAFPTRSQMASRNSPELSRAALTHLTAQKAESPDAPFFAYVHYLDPHGPYSPPPEYHRRVGGEPIQNPLRLYGGLRKRCYWLRQEGFGPGTPRFEDLVMRYDAETAHTDDAVRELVEGLDSAGLMENTLVIVTADHGEEFLDHDFLEHAWTVYMESLRVPLVFWAPGQLAPAVEETRVSLVDLLPTLLPLLGLEQEDTAFDGAPLFDPSSGAWRSAPRVRPIVAENLIQTRNLVRTFIDGPWKYNAAQKWLGFPERERAVARQPELRRALARGERERVNLWGPLVREELFRLDQDPLEQQDRLDDQPETAARMRAIYEDYKASIRDEFPGAASPPSSPEELSESEREDLEALGYL